MNVNVYKLNSKKLRSLWFQKFVVLLVIQNCFQAATFSKVLAQTQAEMPNTRMNFVLGTARSYASKFDPQTRSLYVRISPAKAEEFNDTSYYDSRFVHRIVVKENKQVVELKIQLKMGQIGWLVTSQSSPWRLLIDFWNTTKAPKFKDNTIAGEWVFGDSQSGNSLNSNESIMLGKTQRLQSPEGLQSSESTILAEGKENSVEPVNVIPLNVQPREELSYQKASLGFLLTRIELPSKTNQKEIDSLKSKLTPGIPAEIDVPILLKIGSQLYGNEQYLQAFQALKSVAVASENSLTENQSSLWHAGESAFLVKNFDAAQDYFQTLKSQARGTALEGQAKLRLLDISALKQNTFDEKKLLDYSNIALSEAESWPAKIAATLRVFHSFKENIPNDAKKYQAILNNCVNKSPVPIALVKECSYFKARVSLEQDTVVEADNNLSKFQNQFSSDARITEMQKRLEKKITLALQDTSSQKNWDTWARIEQNIRPSSLNFTLRNSNYLIARAEALELAGFPEKAVPVLKNAILILNDGAERLSVLSAQAKIESVLGNSKNTSVALTKMFQSSYRKQSGLAPKAILDVRTLALAPYKNKTALLLLVDEMKAARHFESDISAIEQMFAISRKQPMADFLVEKIKTQEIKTPEQKTAVEKVLWQHAEDLRAGQKLEASAEAYKSAANLPQSSKRAEALYKAGILYARTGALEKAKASWEEASADTTDQKYSALASEKLDKLR